MVWYLSENVQIKFQSWKCICVGKQIIAMLVSHMLENRLIALNI